MISVSTKVCINGLLEDICRQSIKNILPPEQTKDRNSPPKQMKYSNLRKKNIDQLYENINQWKEAYETLKEHIIV